MLALRAGDDVFCSLLLDHPRSECRDIDLDRPHIRLDDGELEFSRSDERPRLEGTLGVCSGDGLSEPLDMDGLRPDAGLDSCDAVTDGQEERRDGQANICMTLTFAAAVGRVPLKG